MRVKKKPRYKECYVQDSSKDWIAGGIRVVVPSPEIL